MTARSQPSAGLPRAVDIGVDVGAEASRSPPSARDRFGVHRLADWARTVRLLRHVFGRWREGTARVEDRWHRIKTEALIEPDMVTPRDDAHLYVPLAYGQVRRVLRALRLGPNDVIADVGCGLGRLVALAAQLPVSHVIGMECDSSLADSARDNLRRLRNRRSPAEIVTVDAGTADFGRVTVLVLFNPFGPRTMRAMLDCLRASIDESPRLVRIAYVNPTAESELLRCGWLRRTATTRSATYRHAVSFWETTRVSCDAVAWQA